VIMGDPVQRLRRVDRSGRTNSNCRPIRRLAWF